jgi:hypothetical protein
MPFKETVTVYSENHAKPINTKCSITDCQSSWFIQLPLGLKGLRWQPTHQVSSIKDDPDLKVVYTG